MKLLCTIDAKFNKELWDPLPLAPGDEIGKELKFDIIMKATAGSLNWSVKCQGQTCGERNTKVMYE